MSKRKKRDNAELKKDWGRFYEGHLVYWLIDEGNGTYTEVLCLVAAAPRKKIPYGHVPVKIYVAKEEENFFHVANDDLEFAENPIELGT